MSIEFQRIGQAPANTEVLSLKIMDAIVTVRHEGREDIAVFANYPEHWMAGEDGTVRQTGVRQLYSDVRVIIEVHGFNLGEWIARQWRRLIGQEPTTSPAVTQPEVPAKPVKPQLGPDQLLVLVPINYAGCLDLDVDGSSNCEVDYWTGGSVKIDCGSTGQLSVGNVKVQGPFSISHCNDGDVHLGDVEAGSIESSFTGDGNHTLGNFTSTGEVSLRQENSTSIEARNISGADVTVELNGDYGITIGDINATGHLEFTRYGDGDLSLGKVLADSAKFEATGDGSLDLGNIACERDLNISQENSTTIDAKDITGGAVTIELNGDWPFTAGAISASGRLVLNRWGDGDLTVASLAGDIIETQLYGNGSHNLDRLKAGTIKVDHDDGDAGVELKEVQATSFTLNHSSDGEVEIGRLDTTAINFDCNGDGNVTVNGGSAQSGRVYNSGDLYLTLTGRFGYISQKNDGGGEIEVEIAE